MLCIRWAPCSCGFYDNRNYDESSSSKLGLMKSTGLMFFVSVGNRSSRSHALMNLFSAGAVIRVPTRCWKYWKSNEFQNRFSRPWKSIEFGQNVH